MEDKRYFMETFQSFLFIAGEFILIWVEKIKICVFVSHLNS